MDESECVCQRCCRRLATKLGYCNEPPKGVCSRAFVEGGTHNTNFDGVCFYPRWSLPGYAAIFRCACTRRRQAQGDQGRGTKGRTRPARLWVVLRATPHRAPWVLAACGGQRGLRPRDLGVRRRRCCVLVGGALGVARRRHPNDELNYCYYLIPCGKEGYCGDVTESDLARCEEGHCCRGGSAPQCGCFGSGWAGDVSARPRSGRAMLLRAARASRGRAHLGAPHAPWRAHALRLHNEAIKKDPFISQALGPNAKLERMRAASLRVGGQGVLRTVDEHLLIVGDAAGHIDPLTGEGIHTAMMVSARTRPASGVAPRQGLRGSA